MCYDGGETDGGNDDGGDDGGGTDESCEYNGMTYTIDDLVPSVIIISIMVTLQACHKMTLTCATSVTLLVLTTPVVQQTVVNTTDGGETDGGTGDTGLEDAICSATFAECTEEDFEANDYSNNSSPITINMIGMQPYSPKCLTIRVGQTVIIEANNNHPFSVECAEDDIMDSQDGSTTDVESTFATPGYYAIINVQFPLTSIWLET